MKVQNVVCQNPNQPSFRALKINKGAVKACASDILLAELDSVIPALEQRAKSYNIKIYGYNVADVKSRGIQMSVSRIPEKASTFLGRVEQAVLKPFRPTRESIIHNWEEKPDILKGLEHAIEALKTPDSGSLFNWGAIA